MWFEGSAGRTILQRFLAYVSLCQNTLPRTLFDQRDRRIKHSKSIFFIRSYEFKEKERVLEICYLER